MKKLILSISLAVFLQSMAQAQNIEIADPIFKAYLLANEEINTNGDEHIQLSEAIAFSGSIGIRDSNLEDLSGIEHFINLEHLFIPNNKIKNLDLSKNTKLKRLGCNNNQITQLDLSHQPLLELLVCNNNNLTHLQLAPEHEIKMLMAHENQINTLYLGASPQLHTFWIQVNEVNHIDLTSFPQLESLLIKGGAYTSLNTSKNPILSLVNLYDAKYLQALDLSKNPRIESLSIDAPIENLDISNLEKLSWFTLNNVNFRNLDLSHNLLLERLDIDSTALEKIHFNKASLLNNIIVRNTPLTSLDLQNIPKLNYILLENTPLKALDFKENILLKNLNLLDNNQLKQINISNNKALETLAIINSPIDYLDLSQQKELYFISQKKTNLKYLDLSKQEKLNNFVINENEYLEWINLSNKQNKKIEKFYLQYNPALHCVQVDDAKYSENTWSSTPFEKDNHIKFSNDCNIAYNSNHTLSMIYPNPAKDIIYIESKSEINIEIINLQGAIIRQEKLQAGSNKIDIQNLNSGMYLIQAKGGESIKFIKA